jgi:uncharacterized protein YgbK (DUF1537 family)
MRMGVVADDITGSNDIGIMFAKEGCLAHIYTYSGEGSKGRLSGRDTLPDICILNTNSRLDPAPLAYQKVYAATLELQEAGCHRFFNKTCSVFRGNIGAEFDAMLDALDQDFAVVVLGFPKNGRTTIDGVHYVHGRRLEESEFRNDPIHPMTRSNLVEILGSQTDRKVESLNYEWVARGPGALLSRIEELRSTCNYLILDVRYQADLRTIAGAVQDIPVLCGSSALAEELPGAWGVPKSRARQIKLPKREGIGILCVAGSLMPQTAAQLNHLKNAGLPAYELDTGQLFDPDARQAEIRRLVEAIVASLVRGEDALFYSPGEPDRVEATLAAGSERGLSGRETSRLVSETIAEVSALALEFSGQNRLVVAGGETSAAVCGRLGAADLMIWEEIQPGLPSCFSLSTEPLLLVLKSGSFGTPDFLKQAIDHLRAQ